MRVNLKEYKKLIKQIGTQKQVAEAIGITPQSITDIMCGKRKLTKKHMLIIIGLKTVLGDKKLSK